MIVWEQTNNDLDFLVPMIARVYGFQISLVKATMVESD